MKGFKKGRINGYDCCVDFCSMETLAAEVKGLEGLMQVPRAVKAGGAESGVGFQPQSEGEGW